MAEGIVVVDRSPILARAVAEVAGAQLGMTPSEAIAPEALCDGMAPPLLAVLDPGQLDDFGGTVSHLISRDADTRVVAFAERPSVELAQYCIEIGCHGFLPKSADTEMLLRALRVVVDGGSYIDRVYGRQFLQNGSHGNGPTLSWREEHILRKLARGYSATCIAEELSLSVKTVDTYRARAMKKLSIQDRPALVRLALARGWLS